MKRILTTLLFVSATSLLLAQTVNEIIKFSQQANYGTSRGMSMGGAVGALSSEYASVNVNPAALGTFHMGQIIFTPRLDIYKTNSNGEPDTRNSFVINGAGIVYSFDNSNGNFNRFNLSFGYNLHTNFNAYYSTQGTPAHNESLTDYMLGKANAHYEGYDAWANNAPFISRVGNVFEKRTGYDLKSQQQRITTIGHAGEYSLAFGTSYLDKLYLGVSAGLSDLRYERRDTYDETGSFNNAETNILHETASFINGRGVGARLGLLYTPLESFTIGLAVQSPVFYSLSVRTNGNINVSTVLEDNSYDFTLRTPWHLSLNASYAVNTLAVFSFDYEVVTNNLISLHGDYAGMTQATTDNIHAINDYLLSDATKVAMNFRVGGEVRLQDFFLRGGFAYLGAPTNNFKGVIVGSGGLGYRIGFASVDVGYRYATSSEEYHTYTSSPLITTDYSRHQFLLTISYRF
ncbi:MAG: outer membrane protein transport protein [Prevotellaceae bacterium]|jgi:hypothetical protein|nr:outer membrane protein transport protein [Prevotellaceae bacterium]